MNARPFLAGFVAALLVSFVVLGGVLFYFVEKGSSVEVLDQREKDLKGAVADMETKAGMRCTEVRAKMESILSTKIDPIIQLFKAGGNWRANLTPDLSESMNKIGDMGMRCNIYLNFMGERAGRLPDESLRQFSRIESLVRYGLTAEKCDRECLSGQFGIIEKAREQLKSSLR